MSTTGPISSSNDPWSAQLAGMSIAEKEALLERLVIDLAKNAEHAPSPDWHRQILEERERAVAEGRSQFRDWEVAKRDILERISKR